MDKLEVHINDTVFDEIKAKYERELTMLSWIEMRLKNCDQKLTFFRERKTTIANC